MRQLYIIYFSKNHLSSVLEFGDSNSIRFNPINIHNMTYVVKL